MRKSYILLAGTLALSFMDVKAQTKIGGTGAPDNSAMLEVTGGTGNNKGALLPRLTMIERDAIPAPATGLIIYNTTSNQLQVNTGTPLAPIWSISSGSNAWNINGNTATDPATNFIGTTDAQPLFFRTNNTSRMVLNQNGWLGLGTANPALKMTLSSDQQGPGPGDDIGIISYGASTQPALVTYTARGTESAPANAQSGDFMGGTYFGTRVNGNLTLLSWVHGRYLGDGTTISSDLEFITNAVERMRIDSAGNVGIGTTVPVAKLDVNGTARISGSTGTPTAITGRDATGNIGNVTLGAGLTLTGGTLSAVATQAGWNLTGNAGTDPATNFIGTTDAQPLVLRTNNTEKLRITTDGNVGLGVTAPTAQLQLANTLAPRKLVLWDGAPGNPNRFFGLGVESLMMRYQVNNTGDNHVFFSGTTDSTSRELMRIQGNGNVGIGTATPAATLDVNGTARISGSAGTPTAITGRDAAGNISNITLGTGINLTAGTLSVPTPSVQLLQGILVPNGANVGGTTTGYLSTGATITLPANSTYIITADMMLSTVPIGQSASGSVPAGQSLWVRSSFADVPGGQPTADLVGNNQLMSGTISAGMIFNMLHGAVTISNTSNAPKTYYYIVGNVVNNGFTPTLYGFGASDWAENQIYAIPID